jgi:hypothetical protein
MSKKALIIIIFLVAVVLLTIGTIGFVFFLTNDAVKSANNFLSLVKSGNFESAYQETSQQFKVSTSIDEFKAFAINYSLDKNKNTFWNSRAMDPSGATLKGSFKTDDGKTVPLEMMLVKDNKIWRVLNIDVKGGISQKTTFPSDADITKLTNNTIQLFADAINKEDFSEFFGSISKLWQGQITAQKLEESFKAFIDNKIDMTVLKGIDPAFSTKPALDENGNLVLNGYYVYEESKVNFKLQYVYEYPEWKLFGINVSIK